MHKCLVTLLMGAILVGAVYATAASLSLSGTDNVGAGTATIVAPSNVTGIVWTLSTDTNFAETATISLSSTGTQAAGDTINFQLITDGDTPANCDGTTETTVYAIEATGTTASTKLFNLFLDKATNDSKGTQTVGDGTISIAEIDCIKITIRQGS